MYFKYGSTIDTVPLLWKNYSAKEILKMEKKEEKKVQDALLLGGWFSA